MAAKRVSATAINWGELAKKIPDGQRVVFQALKTRQDGYVRAINQLPENLPAIDFASYKGRVAPGARPPNSLRCRARISPSHFHLLVYSSCVT